MAKGEECGKTVTFHLVIFLINFVLDIIAIAVRVSGIETINLKSGSTVRQPPKPGLIFE
jgi:hypothetical protein